MLSNIKRKVVGYKQYSQFGEDTVLMELFKDTKKGRYVDVGAHHPYRYSKTYLLFKKGWRGVNIDPNPESIKLFEHARPMDENICSAVGEAGTLTYYQFSDPAVNTFGEKEAKVWKNKSFLTFLGTRDVAVRPLSTLVSCPIDLLTIDVEGMNPLYTTVLFCAVRKKCVHTSFSVKGYSGFENLCGIMRMPLLI